MEEFWISTCEILKCAFSASVMSEKNHSPPDYCIVQIRSCAFDLTAVCSKLEKTWTTGAGVVLSPRCAQLSRWSLNGACSIMECVIWVVDIDARLRSRSTLLRCAAGVALCVAFQAALSFVAPAGGAAKAGIIWNFIRLFDLVQHGMPVQKVFEDVWSKVFA